MARLREATDFHDPRGTLAYAHVLLRAGDVDRAQRAVRGVLGMQETREGDAHCGNFRWLLEDAGVNDLNGVEFMLDELIPLLREYREALGDGLCEEMRRAIALGLEEIERLDVHPSYTNIALSDIANSVLGGELLGEARWVERGAERLDEWLAFTDASGAPHEFNSPTYLGVDILRAAAVAEHARDRGVAFRARVAEERLWQHVAAHWHPGLAQLGGAHSREYFDGWSGAGGLLKLLIWRLLGSVELRRETPYARRSREEGHVPVALATLHCPDYVQTMLREKAYPFVARETADAARGIDITTHMTADYVLGTASRSYAVGSPPEPWPAFTSMHLYFRRDGPPGYGALYSRYAIDDSVPGEGGHRGDDHYDVGQHVAAQHGNVAIVAYGLTPRLRASHSCRLSVRLLGFGEGDEAWVGERRVDAWPAPVAAGETVAIATGDIHITLVPLAPSDMGHGAPIELTREGGVVSLDIYNYKGQAKSFWEHRSQAGPFYKGNVRNAFAIEVAGRSDYPDVDAWRRRAAQLRVSDAVDDQYRRTITCTTPDGAVSMTYSLWDMSLIERRADGEVIAPPMSRAGAASGDGPQLVVSREASTELGRLTVESDASAKWVFADDDARRYVVVRPSDAAAAMRLRTPDTVIGCDAFGFRRIDVDERAGTVSVETAGETGAVRVRSSHGLRVIVNGDEAAAERV
ncbi:MAG: hypothetical protein EPO22_15125 [Dehalococcoidia bacterium]|nr:MAG: hypothetical protein EPO22_15125 [Dehalococcoidia bacterium]